MTQILKPPEPTAFTAEPAQDTSSVTQTLAKTIPAPTAGDLRVKYFLVDLPSKGKLGYPAQIEYRDILVRDEKILASTTATNYLTVLHRVLKSLLKDQSYFENISIADRDFLLVWIWANCYSAEKTVDMECPQCNQTAQKTIDLTKLKVNDIADDIEVPFEYETSNGLTLLIRPVTIGMQDAATTYVKEHPDCDFNTALTALTFTIKGRISSPALHIKFVEENVRGKDFAMVRAYHEHYAYGVDEEIQYECPHCHEVSAVRSQFQAQWFLPTDKRDFERLLQSHQGIAHQPD